MTSIAPNDQASASNLDPLALLAGEIRRPRRSPFYLLAEIAHAAELGELLVGLEPLPLPADDEPGEDATSTPDTPPHPPAPSPHSDSSPPATP